MENIGNGKGNDVGQSPYSSISTIRSNTTSTRTRRTETSLAKAFTVNTGERHNNKWTGLFSLANNIPKPTSNDNVNNKHTARLTSSTREMEEFGALRLCTSIWGQYESGDAGIGDEDEMSYDYTTIITIITIADMMATLARTSEWSSRWTLKPRRGRWSASGTSTTPTSLVARFQFFSCCLLRICSGTSRDWWWWLLASLAWLFFLVLFLGGGALPRSGCETSPSSHCSG